jgi:hypothetical protein
MGPTRTAVLLATLGVAVSACGAEVAPEELFAVSITDAADEGPAALGLTDLGDADGEALDLPAAPPRADEVTDDPPAPPPEPTEPAPEPAPATAATAASPDEPADEVARGPSDRDVARFVARHKRDAAEYDHHVADLTGDGVVEVVVGRRSVAGAVEVVLGVWDGAAFVDRGAVSVDTGATALGALVVRDLDGDGRPELLLPHLVRPHRSLLVAEVGRRGELGVPAACPLAEPSGSTLDFGQGAGPVTLACHPRDVRGGEALFWDEGRFGGAGVQAAGAERGRGR